MTAATTKKFFSALSRPVKSSHHPGASVVRMGVGTEQGKKSANNPVDRRAGRFGSVDLDLSGVVAGFLCQFKAEYAVLVAGGDRGFIGRLQQGEGAELLAVVALAVNDLVAFLLFLFLLGFGTDRRSPRR